jgi:UDP-N-acetylglucosamine--N-acetylmuramyl-(pentapeptide) pyrophosphoryl-undecaprenol N-acetylglucosamine transferase
MRTVLFAGGGTGGHIYPGIAVAERLLKTGEWRIVWIGSDAGLDKTLVEGAGLDISFFGVPSGKLRRDVSLNNVLKNVSDIFRIIAGFFASRKIIKREKPALLFSKGGFASVPPVLAAASLKIPVFTHESDVSPGLATQINARFAARIFVSYEDTASRFPARLSGKITVTGNPVRSVFRNADKGRGLAFLGIPADSPDKILFVLGGSQGAREVNDLVRDNRAALTQRFIVVHQTGREDWDIPESPRYKPFRFIAGDMPHVLASASLALGRSGAGTVWECAASGTPMALVPLRGSGTRGDQVENARFFEKAGAAIVIKDEGGAAGFVNDVIALADDEARLTAMARAALDAGKLDGACSISRFFDEVS